MTLVTDDIQTELIAITRQLLQEFGGPYKREIKIDASLQRHLGIDSLGRAELFQRIEKRFNVTMPDRLLMQAETLKDIADFLQQATPKIETLVKPSIISSHGERTTVDISHAKTLLDVLLMYGDSAPNKAHIYFQSEDGSEEIITYADLLKKSLQVANSLRELGLKENETVAIMQPTNPGFFYTFFGTLFAGGIPVPIYPPFRMHMLEAYAKTEAKILTNAEVRVLVTFEEAENLSHILRTFVPSLKHVVTVADLLQAKEIQSRFDAKPENFAFIQYTSGSTAAPKGVLLTHRNLIANISAYGKTIHAMPDDVAVSWLPLYHDMGLIGMWLGSLVYGVPLILLTPFTFLNHPERWLWAIHYHRGTVTGAPNFAYELCVKKIDTNTLEGLDLSSLRIAANGAEKIYPRTLEKFAKKFAPFGFNSKALLPVYGLAESTVALTIPPLNREFWVDKINREQFEKERLAEPTKENHALEFVSCGKPMEGHKIRIVDDNNQELPERHVGNLQFTGPSNMQGYYHNPDASKKVFHDGWIDSGDLAYIANEELFITGRRKDLIIKAGRNIYPAEIEEMVGMISGVRQGCVVAFGASNDENATEELIIVAETKEKDKSKQMQITEKIMVSVAETMDIVIDKVVLVAPHIVPKTSSGKLQRSACKNMYLQGQLGKTQTPPWLQVTKLGWKVVWHKLFTALKYLGKSIYTFYAWIVLFGLLLPLYIVVCFATRDVAAKACQIVARIILFLLFCPLELKNSDKLNAINAPVIFAANHASYVDSFVMVAILPPSTRYVVKKELFSVPFIRTFMRKLDYISVDRADLTKGLEDTKHIEKELAVNPVMIFPEGTFGYPSGLRPFRLGTFKIAIETTTPVCPVALQGTRFILRAEEFLMWPQRIIATIGNLVQPAGKEWQHVTQMRDMVRAEIAKYCGEPSLDFIAAQTVASKRTES